MKFALVLLFSSSLLAAADTSIYHDGWIDLDKNGKKDVYENPAQPIHRRVADLLSRMTLDEEIGQLWQGHRGPDAEAKFSDLLRHGGVSSFLDGSALVETPEPRNRLQHIAVEESRLGIPLIFGHDSIHGFRTIFPIPLAEACAWEPDLFERTQIISARETAAVGIDWSFAPMVDLARDPRWGRIAEGFGEDPWLGSLYAIACVRGFQGTNVTDPNHVVACLKHYVGYGATEGGRDYNTTEISEYTLRNFYLPQFKAGVEAGALTVMSAFNCLSGFPASANHHTLTDILRHEWGFSGYVISDWTSVSELIPHGVAANEADAARLALTAGVDIEMVSTTYRDTLKQLIAEKKLRRAVVDEAVRRVLTVKFARGLFDRPYVDENLQYTAFLQPDALVLAREAAAKCCVLLKNDKGMLPLSPRIKKVALLGPLANEAGEMLGCWAARGRAEDAISLAAGVRQKLSPVAELKVVPGCRLLEGEKTIKLLDGTIVSEGTAGGRNDIEQAVTAAKGADVVILALGEPSSWCGENSSRSDLTLSGRQMELFDAVAATGKRLIVVLFSGRPLALPHIQEKAAAILEVWHPGVQGGNGIADVLFGDADPSGRLTVTVPRSVGQVPTYYNHYNTGRPDLGKYVDGSREPLYPFGFGLTYTTFEYGKVELGSPTVKIGDAVTAHVHLKNTGTRAGSEVVQLYIRAMAATAGPRPVRELKGFQKVQLNPGESKDVEFRLSGPELGYYDTKGDWLVEPGKYKLWITKDSASGEAAEFQMTE